MGAAGSSAVDATNAIRSRLASLAGQASAPGTLTKWADGDDNKYWEFTGNGETSASDFVHAAVRREAADGDKDFLPVADSRPFADSAAKSLLGAADPSQPIAKGEVQELSLKDLVRLVAPFLATYAASQSAKGGGGGVAGHDPTSDDERTRVATGQVVSQGLSLPLD